MEPDRQELPPRSPEGRGLLSVVVPCFDEEAVIGEAHRRLAAALGTLPGMDFEIVYVDDGSRDATPDLLREIQQVDRRVRLVVLSRNFGQDLAITAGLEHAAGDAVVLIDADLQDPPEVIPEMVERWRQGVAVAYGQRTEREGESRFKLWTAAAFYRLIARVSEVSIPRNTGNFRLMDRAVVEAFLSMPESARFVRGMVTWTGFRQEPVPFRRAARFAGDTKWPLRHMIRLALDAVLSFSDLPLRLLTWLGAAALAASLVGAGLLLAVRLAAETPVGAAAAVAVAAVFLGGVQLLAAGVLGEYLGRIYREVRRRPLYLVAERLGFRTEGGPAGGRRPLSGGAAGRAPAA